MRPFTSSALWARFIVLVLSIFSQAGCGGGSGSANGNGTVPPITTSPLAWVWVNGSKVANAFAVYGSEGTASSSNVPSARTGSVTWTDSAGNLWLFGGAGDALAGNNGNLNDLWEYSLSTRMWTWIGGSKLVDASGVYGIQGTPSTSNVPGARQEAVAWTDSAGNFWLFGGEGFDFAGYSGNLNDLWEYSPSAKSWSWVGGSKLTGASGVYGTQGTASAGNVPGARQEAVSWIDSAGNLWLFGGYGVDSAGNTGDLNDLWEYNTSDKTWTWVSGSNLMSASGVYGTQGTASANDVPGARQQGVTWIDSSDNLWLFGGYGFDSAGNANDLNDLWEYSPSAKTWTWVSGLALVNSSPVYGTQGTPSTGNVPGARQEAISWIDSAGNLWLFGGTGVASAGGTGDLNDLWKYDPSAKTWVWIDGSNEVAGNPVYGIKGTAAIGNVPGARQSAVAWIDSTGNFWMFAGYGIDSADNTGDLNDLWEFTP
jgi:N-acetylneuraminic acid mutarotase